jgi:hypothetical protein
VRSLGFLLTGTLVVGTAGLSGCRHRVQTLPVPQQQAPPLNPSSITVITPLPSIPPEAKPKVEQASTPKPPPQAAPVVKKPRRHRRHAEVKDKHPTNEIAAADKPEIETQPAATPTPESPAASAVSAAQWSTGTALDPKQRSQMITSIQVQEHRAGDLKVSSSADQQAIVVQIKLFLEKARDAVANNDLDGAMTLTTKARVLLDELQGTEP